MRSENGKHYCPDKIRRKSALGEVRIFERERESERRKEKGSEEAIKAF